MVVGLPGVFIIFVNRYKDRYRVSEMEYVCAAFDLSTSVSFAALNEMIGTSTTHSFGK